MIESTILAGELTQIALGGRLVDDLLALEQIFPQALAQNQRFRSAVKAAASAMRETSPRALIGD